MESRDHYKNGAILKSLTYRKIKSKNIMKKFFLKLSAVFVMFLFVTSCFTYTFSVGDGPQSGVEVVERNHYLIYGLAPIKTSDPVQMAGGAKDYEVKVEHTFIDGLLNAITGGLYTPTTTTVKK